MNPFKYLLRLIFSKKINTGALPENRPEEDILKDWLHEELADGTTPILYVTKEEADKQKKYVVYNQKKTSSCVGHATATEITVLMLNKFGKIFKGLALFIYRLRSNFSGEGMIGNNANEIAIKYGVPSYDIYPYTDTEGQANAMALTPEMYSDGLKQKPIGYFKFKNNSWDDIASVVSNGTGVKMFINASIREWSKEFVSIMDPNGPFEVSHAIIILPKTVFKHTNGEEYVLIQDSAWFGGLFYRYVPKSFFDAGRLYYSSYFTNLEYRQGQGAKPYHNFTVDLKYGDVGPEVKALQDILIYEGLLPVGYNTGNFYGLTLKGVKNYQLKYKTEILTPIGLTLPTGYVGKMTRAKLNQ